MYGRWKDLSLGQIGSALLGGFRRSNFASHCRALACNRYTGNAAGGGAKCDLLCRIKFFCGSMKYTYSVCRFDASTISQSFSCFQLWVQSKENSAFKIPCSPSLFLSPTLKICSPISNSHFSFPVSSFRKQLSEGRQVLPI